MRQQQGLCRMEGLLSMCQSQIGQELELLPPETLMGCEHCSQHML